MAAKTWFPLPMCRGWLQRRWLPLLPLLVLVAAPMALAGVAALWIELCKGMYIPGAFLAIPGYLAQGLLTLYATPVRALGEGLCFTGGDRAIVTGLPCDAATWAAVALFYSLIAMALTMLGRGLLLLWRRRR
jgi:hypothetical protein